MNAKDDSEIYGLSLPRYRELEETISNLPLQGPGLLESTSVTLGELGVVKGDRLMRYRQKPIALVKSHNPDLPRHPGKSFLTLSHGSYNEESTRVSHNTTVEVVDLGAPVPRNERATVCELANRADWARTCEIALSQAHSAGAQTLVVHHSKPRAPGYSKEYFYGEEFPVDVWHAVAAYLSPVWLSAKTRPDADAQPSVYVGIPIISSMWGQTNPHLDAYKSFRTPIPLPPFVAELCEPLQPNPILPNIDCYLIEVAVFEDRFRDEIARLS